MGNYKLLNIKDLPGGMDMGFKYYFSKWGSPKSYNFFYDAMLHSSNEATGLPRFYVLQKNNEIIGCCGLVTNDFISRHDLYPWLAGVYIEPAERGKELGNLMMRMVEEEAKKIGFSKVYLTTDHDGYYEKYGWQRMQDGYDLNGEKGRIYWKDLR